MSPVRLQDTDGPFGIQGCDREEPPRQGTDRADDFKEHETEADKSPLGRSGEESCRGSPSSM